MKISIACFLAALGPAHHLATATDGHGAIRGAAQRNLQECNLLTDPCPFTLDLECDDPSGLNLCPSNSDCFDCDPFQQFRDLGCGACTSNGGLYCETAGGTPVCSSPDIAAIAPNACLGGGGTPYMSTCVTEAEEPPQVRPNLLWFNPFYANTVVIV